MNTKALLTKRTVGGAPSQKDRPTRTVLNGLEGPKASPYWAPLREVLFSYYDPEDLPILTILQVFNIFNLE